LIGRRAIVYPMPMPRMHARAEVMSSPEGRAPSRISGLRTVRPPQSDGMPTIPCDLSDYAWAYTGPGGSVPDLVHRDLPFEDAAGDATPGPSGVYEPALLFSAGSIDELTTDLLIDLWRRDVPRVVADDGYILDDVEDRMLALMDGRATVGALVDRSGIDPDEFVDRLCDLCTRGLVALDRSRRLAR
jgi:hypothetical protein